jgi:hypothetical protein
LWLCSICFVSSAPKRHHSTDRCAQFRTLSLITKRTQQTQTNAVYLEKYQWHASITRNFQPHSTKKKGRRKTKHRGREKASKQATGGRFITLEIKFISLIASCISVCASCRVMPNAPLRRRDGVRRWPHSLALSLISAYTHNGRSAIIISIISHQERA